MPATITIRADEADRAAWARAATAADQTLSAWIRDALTDAVEAAATGSSRRGRATRQRPAEAPLRPCPRARHHRPGTFCKTCGQSIP